MFAVRLINSETIKLNVSKTSCSSHPNYTNQDIMLGYIGYKEEYNYHNHHVLLRFAK